MPGPEDTPETLERFHATLDLVEVIARQLARTIGPGTEVDDLVSFGREGLLDAARRYDPSRGVPFRAYANYRIRGAVLDGVRSMAALPRRVHERLRGLQAGARVSEGAAEDAFAPRAPGSAAAEAERALSEHLAALATAIGMGLVAQAGIGEEGERTAVAAGESPEEAVARAELLSVVRRALEALLPDEAALVRRHYLENEQFDSVAKELGLSKSWASRLHTRAIAKLAKRLRSGGA